MDTTLEEAQAAAARFADESCLPQTVYLLKDSGGWWHTNPLASLLVSAEVFVTVLPLRYFA
ncbi:MULTISPECIES: hypothetical protein [Pseudomonadota]|jgi:hypothetical protein|uniref:Uncharacterized protein n=1 Tax=Ralstonia thomasii TaxID=3058596 RepID=A0AAD2BUI8_9RALS|nr:MULTISPECIES: hypothetical protein [Pseudomonadota]KAA8636997.1 hypothetical protein FZN37_004347 [Enterobacter hormaechei]NOZ14505.1 hypothetical protein [Betaproteobacteria bacterium]MBA9871475.1 hypothetical protein [Ralstonia insidiosa]MBA9916331.1 hypothetical protein [Ralstonia insidiosa]MBA9955450.1 hypothetical protein [Ralstonia insidiosa]